MRVRWLGFLVLGFELLAQAQTRYVTDRTIVEMRRGPSTEYLILRNLEAGERVEVLEQNEDAGYSRVRVADQGTEGWILTRFLTAEPIARERLAVAERSLAAARERVTALEGQTAELTRDLAATRTELEQTRTNHGNVSKELADIRTAAANVVEIRDQNTTPTATAHRARPRGRRAHRRQRAPRGPQQSELVRRRRGRAARRNRDRARCAEPAPQAAIRLVTRFARKRTLSHCNAHGRR